METASAFQHDSVDGASVSKFDSGQQVRPSDDEKPQIVQCFPGEGTRRWTVALLSFGPSWFALTQGTGIVSVILNRLPYNGDWLYWLSIVLFVVNILLFTVFTIVMTMRFVIFRGLLKSTLKDNVQLLFLGCIPMSLATINQMICYVCFPAWGAWVGNLAWTVWWIDVTLSLSSCFILPFVMMNSQEHTISKMTCAWLLPVISAIVCAGAGGTVASILPDPNHRLWTILISYALLGMGFMLSLMILTIYYYRLILYGIPPRESIMSVFLPLGPLGQGGFAFQQLGLDALETFSKTDTLNAMAGQIFYAGGYLVALLIWGFALAWLFFAIASVFQGRFSFNMTWWSSVFPLGVFTMSTIQLGRELPSTLFKVLGTVFGAATTLIWLFVSAKTLQHTINGQLLSIMSNSNFCVRGFTRSRKQPSLELRSNDNG